MGYHTDRSAIGGSAIQETAHACDHIAETFAIFWSPCCQRFGAVGKLDLIIGFAFHHTEILLGKHR